MKSGQVVVVGGGFAGLAVAHYASQRGYKVRLYERSSRLGGLIGTRYMDWGLVETAANGLLRTALVDELFSDLNLTALTPQKQSRKRTIFCGHPKRWPLGPLDTMRLVRFALIRKMAKERLRPTAGISVAEWGEQHLSRNIIKNFLGPALQGIYGAPADRLSASLVLNVFFSNDARQDKAHGLITAPHGMQELIETWTIHLLRSGVDIVLRAPYELPREVGTPHVICTNSDQAAQLLRPHAPRTAELLADIERVSLATVTLQFDQSVPLLKMFGCLFPRDQSVSSLGVLFNKSIFAGRPHSETWILPVDESALDDGHGDVDELLGRVFADRKKLYQQIHQPLSYSYTIQPRALPLYSPKLETILARLELPRNLHLCGNYLGGIGLAKILRSAQDLVEKMES